jgi:hypothetical protein
VTNRGELLQREGKPDAGVMILSGEDHTKHTLVRGRWKPVKRRNNSTQKLASRERTMYPFCIHFPWNKRGNPTFWVAP